MATTVSAAADAQVLELNEPRQRLKNPAFPLSGYVTTALLSLIAVFLTEWVSRGDGIEAYHFLIDSDRPAVLTAGVVALLLFAIDGLIGREHKGALILMPLLLLGAVVNAEKQHYLTDPFYPTDIFFGRQIVQLLPVLAKERPVGASILAASVLAVIVIVLLSWIFAWRRFPRLSGRQRLMRLAIALPLLGAFDYMMDFNSFFWIRDRFQAIPMMWDQKENYAHNGFLLAFAFNLPMAEITTPAGYMNDAIGKISAPPVAIASSGSRPDIIMIMSESLWDPTRLPGVKFNEDPMPFIRSLQGGHMFSPEFGGMTANIEFEAMTGFSNAFLPMGSVPYQQYIRKPIPSLATFLRSEGYSTRAIHPYQNWFWNRSAVYKALGFEAFRSEETMDPMPKRGNFPADEALMQEVIRQAGQAQAPFFFFTVTLQGHGPYEPHRYPMNTVAFDAGAMPDTDREELATYAEGVKQADESLRMLVNWAAHRERETIIVFFGDHLPPLGTAYVSGGYMNDVTASRRAPIDQMKREHETPLIVWSSKSGPVRDIGTISPALIPYEIARLAGLEHPYYTGFLGQLASRFNIVDRYMLQQTDGKPQADWQRQPAVDQTVRDYRFIEHDIMFGKQYGLDRFFPDYRQVVGNGS